MRPVERAIRKVGHVVIGLFLVVIFLPLVGFALYNALVKEREKAIALLAEPGLWLIVLGPVLLWISLTLFYFRLPREERAASLGTLGRNRLNGREIRRQFQEYQRRRGFDWVLWLMTGSAIVTAVLLVALALGA